MEKKTPTEWEQIDKIKIIDPDGWRIPNAPRWDEPITRKDWDFRMGISTIAHM